MVTLGCLTLLGACAARAGAAEVNAPRPFARVLLLSTGTNGAARAEKDRLERDLQAIPGLSVAILSSRQGDYTWRRLREDLAAAVRQADPAGSAGGRLIVQTLTVDSGGLARARALAARPPAGELVLVLQQPRTDERRELLWAAAAGLAGGGRTLTSQTTEQRGLIAAIDVVPTLLAHLRLPIPATAHGRPIRADGALDGAWLRSLRARLEVVYPRRLPALAVLLAACAVAIAAARLARADVHAAIRVAALAVLFAPVAMLLPAALEPSAAVEYPLIAGVSLAPGALADALMPWARSPLAPALAAVLAFSGDALAHTQLLIRSLLGPNPAYGSRFYGIGNELKSALAALAFAAVAAALYRATRSRRAAATMAGTGAALAIVEGWARIGAGVGGVILVCAGAAVATALLLPSAGERRRRTFAAILAAPLLGLALLAALDLSTANGAGHYTGSVLDARSAGEVWRLVEGRYEAAWEELGNGLMPLATALALLLALAGVRYRERLLAPVGGDPAWLAALAGGLTAGVVGALSEDSGPLLLVSAVAALACLAAYLRAAPAPAPARVASNRSGGTVPALAAQHDLVL